MRGAVTIRLRGSARVRTRRSGQQTRATRTSAFLRRAMVVSTGVALASGCALTSSQADADHEAAIVADKVIAPRLELELENSRGGSDEPQTQMAYEWLTSPDADFLGSLRGTGGTRWVAGAPEGSKISVAIYLLWSDTAFTEEERWGRVCREFHAGSANAWRAVDCPDETPQEPPADAVGGTPQ